MRYGEQVFEIAVPLDDVDWTVPDPLPQIVERFHRRHEELYTYALPDQETVLVNARVAVAGMLPDLPQEPRLPRSRADAARAASGGSISTAGLAAAGLRFRHAGAGAGHRRPGDRRIGDDDGAAAPRRPRRRNAARLARHRRPGARLIAIPRILGAAS